VEAKVAYFVQAGMDESVAERIAPAMDDVMGECILRLYRSAAQPVMAELGAGVGGGSRAAGARGGGAHPILGFAVMVPVRMHRGTCGGVFR
jgi:hypothetical protein